MFASPLVRWLVIVSVLPLLSACALLEVGLESLNFQKPSARVQDVKITDINLESVQLTFDLAVTNPNPVAVRSNGFDLALDVETYSVLSLNQPDRLIDLPAQGTGKMSLPITLRFVDLYKVISGLRNKNEFDYAMTAGFHFNLPVLGQFKVPLTWQGQAPIPKLPKIQLASVKLQDLSWSSATLALNLNMLNPNSFGMDLNRFNYRIAANGLDLGAGEVRQVQLAKNKQSDLSIPLQLNFAELGLTAYRLFKGNESVKVGFAGQVDLQPDLDLWTPKPMEFNLSRALSR